MKQKDSNYSLSVAAALAMVGHAGLTGLSIGSSLEGIRQLQERVKRRNHRIKVLKERIAYYDKRLQKKTLTPRAKRALLKHRAEDMKALEKRFTFIGLASVGMSAAMAGSFLVKKLAKLLRDEKIDKKEIEKMILKKRALIKFLNKQDGTLDLVTEAIAELHQLKDLQSSMNR